MTNASSVEPLLTDLFDRLNDGGVDYCVLRNYEELPEHVGNDVDLWVDSRHLDDFREVLRTAVEPSEWELLISRSRMRWRGGGEFFLITTGGPSKILHIDVWSKLYWRGVPFVSEAVIRERLDVKSRQFPIPEQGVEAAQLLVKDLLYNCEVPKRYRSRIREFAMDDPDGFRTALESSLSTTTTEKLTERVRQSDWASIEEIVPSLRRELLLRAATSPSSHQLKNWGAYAREKITEVFSVDRGRFISFIGPDGSGKSTTSQALSSHPITSVFVDISYYHGRFGILPDLSDVIAQTWPQSHAVPGDNSDGEAANQAGARDGEAARDAFGLLRAAMYPLYYSLDFLLGYVVLRRKLSRGELVLFDRYFYDYYYQPEYRRCPRWLLDGLSVLVPEPDFVVFLSNDPETIQERKPELSVDEIRRQLSVCRTIAPGKSLELRTDERPERLVNRLFDHLLQDDHR